MSQYFPFLKDIEKIHTHTQIITLKFLHTQLSAIISSMHAKLVLIFSHKFPYNLPEFHFFKPLILILQLGSVYNTVLSIFPHTGSPTVIGQHIHNPSYIERICRAA